MLFGKIMDLDKIKGSMLEKIRKIYVSFINNFDNIFYTLGITERYFIWENMCNIQSVILYYYTILTYDCKSDDHKNLIKYLLIFLLVSFIINLYSLFKLF